MCAALSHRSLVANSLQYRVSNGRTCHETSKLEHPAGTTAGIVIGRTVGAENAPRRCWPIFSSRQMNSWVLDGYDPQDFYCEMTRGAASRPVRERLAGLSIEALKQRAANANAE